MNRSIYMTMVMLVCCGSVLAQKRDTLEVLRNFVKLSTAYQQMPLYMELELMNSTNFITSEEDTAHMKALFYIQPGVSYMRFGDAEQLVNDSMTLLVSDKLQRMILYAHAQPVLQQMQLLTGLQTNDSSLLQLAQRFTAQAVSREGGVNAILLSGRNLLYGTKLPRESVELQYHRGSKEPLKVITVKRTMLPLTEDDLKVLDQQAEVVTIEGRGRFLVKEQVGTFMYRKILHNTRMTVPATISDRLVKNEEGGFIPVKAYEGYAVTLN
jgi:hypothetical protein